jgi:hypothetical protein
MIRRQTRLALIFAGVVLQVPAGRAAQEAVVLQDPQETREAVAAQE